MARRTDRWILLPPLVALVLFAAGNDHFGFPPPGWLDAFVYFGYFWHYPEHLYIFENYYKASRLPWILPGFVAFRAFGAIAGSLLLHWVTLSAGGVAMYLLLRDTLKDRTVAIVVGVAWVCSTTGHGAGGWGYHALAAATYYVLACWLVVRTASTSSPRAGVLAGAAMACAIHTYPFYVTLAPIVLWLYVAARPSADPGGWGRFAIDVAWMSAGALGLTVLLALISAATGGPWLFIMAQLRTTVSLTQPGSDAWWSEPGRWLPTAKYLVVPLLSLLAVAGVPLFRPSDDVQRLRRAFALQSWGVLAIFAYFYFVHHFGVLNYDYMSLAVYCHAFPALAAMLSSGNVREGAWARPAMLAGAVALILGSLVVGMPTVLATLAQRVAALRPDVPVIVPPIVLGVVGLLVGFALPKRLAVIVFAGWFSIVNAWTTTTPTQYGVGSPGIHREMLRVFRDMDQYTTRLDPTLGGIKYWFTREAIDSPQGRINLAWLFDSYVATRGWYGSLLAHQSPGVPIEQLTPEHLLNVTCLGVLSSAAGHEAIRAQVLGRFEATGPALRLVGEQQFHSKNLALALTVYRVQPSTAVTEAGTDASRPPCQP